MSTVKKLPPGASLEDAVSILQDGPGALREDQIRSLIQEAMEWAKRTNRNELREANVEKAQWTIRKAAKEMLEALEVIHSYEPRFPAHLREWSPPDNPELVTFVQDGTDFICLHSDLPLEDPDAFERDLETMTHLGIPEPIINLANPRPTTGRNRLPVVVVGLHGAAKDMLERAGIKASTGTGGSVASLGALLCSAAGVQLKFGESTKAARLACSFREMLAASGITYSKILPKLNP